MKELTKIILRNLLLALCSSVIIITCILMFRLKKHNIDISRPLMGDILFFISTFTISLSSILCLINSKFQEELVSFFMLGEEDEKDME